MTKREEFRHRLPGTFFLDPGDLAGLADYLAACERLAQGETLLSAQKAGEGNMNCTVRVRTSAGSIRLEAVSGLGWRSIRRSPRRSTGRWLRGGFTGWWRLRRPWPGECPGCYGWTSRPASSRSKTSASASDFFPLYAREITLPEQTLTRLWWRIFPLCTAWPRPAGRAGGVGIAKCARSTTNISSPCRYGSKTGWTSTLTPARRVWRRRRAAPSRTDAAYVRAVSELGERYPARTRAHSLLHGDFFPGSFLTDEPSGCG